MSAVKMGLTIEEAAECTGIGRNTMRKLVDWGKLPVLKVGRKAIIRRDTLERFMAVNQGQNPCEEEPTKSSSVCLTRNWPTSTKRSAGYGVPVNGSSGSALMALSSGSPSVDVPRLIYEVRSVGASLNRILIIANARGLLEVLELRRALERNRELEVRIVDVYTKD